MNKTLTLLSAPCVYPVVPCEGIVPLFTSSSVVVKVKVPFSAVLKRKDFCPSLLFNLVDFETLHLGLKVLFDCGDFKNEMKISCSTTHMIILVNDDRKKMIESGHSDSWWQPIILTQLLCFLALTHYKFCSHLYHGNRNSKTEVLPSTNPSSSPMSPQTIQFDMTSTKCASTTSSPFSCLTDDSLCYSESSEELSTPSYDTYQSSSSPEISPKKLVLHHYKKPHQVKNEEGDMAMLNLISEYSPCSLLLTPQKPHQVKNEEGDMAMLNLISEYSPCSLLLTPQKPHQVKNEEGDMAMLNLISEYSPCSLLLTPQKPHQVKNEEGDMAMLNLISDYSPCSLLLTPQKSCQVKNEEGDVAMLDLISGYSPCSLLLTPQSQPRRNAPPECISVQESSLNVVSPLTPISLFNGIKSEDLLCGDNIKFSNKGFVNFSCGDNHGINNNNDTSSSSSIVCGAVIFRDIACEVISLGHRSGVVDSKGCTDVLSGTGDEATELQIKGVATPRRSARIKDLKRKQLFDGLPKCTRSGKRY